MTFDKFEYKIELREGCGRLIHISYQEENEECRNKICFDEYWFRDFKKLINLIKSSYPKINMECYDKSDLFTKDELFITVNDIFGFKSYDTLEGKIYNIFAEDDGIYSLKLEFYDINTKYLEDLCKQLEGELCNK